MAPSLWDKVKQYIMPESLNESSEEREHRLRPHSLVLQESPQGKMIVLSPAILEQTCSYADWLQDGSALLINYAGLQQYERRTMHDFLQGVCYVLHGQAQIISDEVILYVPEGVAVSCEKALDRTSFHDLFAFNSPIAVQRLGLQ
ncbi:MAG: cell division protein SepF [Sporomusaceae bacterium]|nr:cell division protein SepF [Sporomusaceae bacterium]